MKIGARVVFVSVVLLLSVSSVSTAAIIPSFLDVTSSASPGQFTYFYRVTLTEASRLDSNSRWAQFFTIFDFEGYVPGSATSSNPDFVLTTQNTGLYNAQGAPVEQDGDDPSIVNLTWSWQRCTPAEFCDITDPPAATVVGPVVLGIFSVDSIFSGIRLDAFQAQDTQHNPGKLDDGQRALNEGATTVPLGRWAAADVPEPSIYSLLGFGFVLVGVFGGRLLFSSHRA